MLTNRILSWIRIIFPQKIQWEDWHCFTLFANLFTTYLNAPQLGFPICFHTESIEPLLVMRHLENSRKHLWEGNEKDKWCPGDVMKIIWPHGTPETPGSYFENCRPKIGDANKDGFHWPSWESAGSLSIHLFFFSATKVPLWGVKSEINSRYWFHFSPCTCL